MQYLHSYFSLLLETVDDLVEAFESETTRGFMIAAIILIPLFGSLVFFILLINIA